MPILYTSFSTLSKQIYLTNTYPIYYALEIGQRLDSAPISAVIDNAYNTRSLDRNALVCNNVLELAGNPFTIATVTDLSPDPYYDYNDVSDWTKFKRWFRETVAAVANWYNGLAIVKWYNNVHWGWKLAFGIIFLVLSMGLGAYFDGAYGAIATLAEIAIGVGAKGEMGIFIVLSQDGKMLTAFPKNI